MVDFTLALSGTAQHTGADLHVLCPDYSDNYPDPLCPGEEKGFLHLFLPHRVVTMCYGTCFFMYVKPSPGKEVDLNKGVSLINTVIAPLLNPFIYTLRNQQVKQVKDLVRKMTGLRISSSSARHLPGCVSRGSSLQLLLPPQPPSRFTLLYISTHSSCVKDDPLSETASD